MKPLLSLTLQSATRKDAKRWLYMHRTDRDYFGITAITSGEHTIFCEGSC